MATSNEDLQRAVGHLQGRMDAMEDRMNRIEPKIDTIYRAVTEASGSVRVLLAVASIGAMAGGLLVSVLTYLRGG